MKIGDKVTTAGHTGWGQPLVEGVIVAIKRDVATIKRRDGTTRDRSLKSLRAGYHEHRYTRSIKSNGTFTKYTCRICGKRINR